MSNVPPPLRRPEPPTPSPFVRYLWLFTALFGVAFIAVVVFILTRVQDDAENTNPGVPVSPLLPKQKNLSRIVKQEPDGWFDIVIDDFPIRMQLPNRPGRTPGSRSFRPDASWATDYNAYQTTAQGIAVAITGYWLNDVGQQFFATPGNLDRHADSAAGHGCARYSPKTTVPKSTFRTYSFVNGQTTNYVASIKFMQRPDLVVGINVSARTLPEAKLKLDRILASMKLNDDAKK